MPTPEEISRQLSQEIPLSRTVVPGAIGGAAAGGIAHLARLLLAKRGLLPAAAGLATLPIAGAAGMAGGIGFSKLMGESSNENKQIQSALAELGPNAGVEEIVNRLAADQRKPKEPVMAHGFPVSALLGAGAGLAAPVGFKGRLAAGALGGLLGSLVDRSSFRGSRTRFLGLNPKRQEEIRQLYESEGNRAGLNPQQIEDVEKGIRTSPGQSDRLDELVEKYNLGMHLDVAK